MESLGIQRAIDREFVVRFDYPSSTLEIPPVRRTFSPWEIKGESVIGWDHGRDEIRRYRRDKMGVCEAVAEDDEQYVQPTK